MSILACQRLLIVDDEPLIALALEDFFSDMGIGEVKSALKCGPARECVERAWPTIVLLDISLPDGSGYEIADVLMAKGIPFIFSSGVSEADIPPRFGGAPALGKPVNYGDLSDVVHQITSRPRTGSS